MAGVTVPVAEQPLADIRKQIVGMRKELGAVDDHLAAAKQRSYQNLYEMREQLAVAQAMCEELGRELAELTHGHALERPTRYQVRLLFEARRRIPRA